MPTIKYCKSGTIYTCTMTTPATGYGPRVRVGGTTYSVDVVGTGDPLASDVYYKHPTQGTLAFKLENITTTSTTTTTTTSTTSTSTSTSTSTTSTSTTSTTSTSTSTSTTTTAPPSTYTQTRYMRSDYSTINGTSLHKLDTTNTTSQLTGDETKTDEDSNITWAIRVWKKVSGGSTTELTTDYSAQVTRNATGFPDDSEGEQQGTWSCPETALNTTDNIVVYVYHKIGGNDWYACGLFHTEQLGAFRLDANTWTVTYYSRRIYVEPPTEYTQALFYYGKSGSYDSRIGGFKFTKYD